MASIDIKTAESDEHLAKAEVLAACQNCDRQTYHAVLTQVSEWNEQVVEEHETIQCKGCKRISFRHNWFDIDEREYDYETGDESPVYHVTLYPPRLAGRKPMRDANFVPSKVRAIYKEAHSAACQDLRILAGIGIRAIVEAVCDEKGAKQKTLEKSIDALVPMGVLTPDAAEVLHCTRLVGNEAAHEVSAIDDKTMNAAMDIAEHMLATVYTIPEKAQHLPRRQKTNAPQAPANKAVGSAQLPAIKAKGIKLSGAKTMSPADAAAPNANKSNGTTAGT